MPDAMTPPRSARPVPVRRLRAGSYETLDGRFRLYDQGFGAYRWCVETDWHADPVACAWLDAGEAAWRSLRALRVWIAAVYLDEAQHPTQSAGSALADALGFDEVAL